MAALMNHRLSRLYSRCALFEVLITSYSFLIGRRITAKNKQAESDGVAEGAELIPGFAVGKYLASIIHTFNPGGSFSQSKLTLETREMPEKQPTIGNLH